MRSVVMNVARRDPCRQTAVAYEIARGSVAMYYPEGNALIALHDYDARSGTPAYKSVPVRIVAAA